MLISGGSGTYSLGAIGWPWFWVEGLNRNDYKSPAYDLHVYYHCVREIRRQNNHTAQAVNRSKFNENTQNMHAKKSTSLRK